MGPEEQEPILKSRRLYFRLSLICLFSLALLHGIHPFFFTFFFWLSLGFIVLTIYYYVLIKREENKATPKFTSNPYSSNQASMPAQSRQLILFIALGIGSLFFVIFILATVFSNGENDTAEINEDVDAELYQQALDRYNQKDYRGAITLLRPELLKGIPDSQSMLLLGDGYYESQDLDSAYVWYSKAYELGERSAILSHLMAYILDTKGNTIEAKDFYKQALSQDSSRTDIYSRLAELEPEKANWYLQKAEQFKEK